MEVKILFQLPEIVGILNLTPDSFYDGGRHRDDESAWGQFEGMAASGAAWIDIGGESSRPGSPRVPLEEELRRVKPILERWRRESHRFPTLTISIDTMKVPVARLAAECGAGIINDISGLCHDEQGMAELLREKPHLRLVLMHMKGNPETMQQHPQYDDVFREVAEFFEQRLGVLEQQGIARDRVILDPGIGFGKRLEHNLELLRRAGELKSEFGLKVMIGASRKSFISMAAGDPPLAGRASPEALRRGAAGESAPEQRLGGSLAVAVWCAAQNVDYLRVHDVAATRQAALLWQRLSS